MDSGFQELSYTVLRTMYDDAMSNSKGVFSTKFSIASLSQNLSIDKKKILDILEYLQQKNLIEIAKPFHNKVEQLYRINQKGIDEIEHSLKSPNTPTEHFMMSVVQNFNAPVGSVQNAPHSTANVTQNNAANINDIIALIKELKEIISKELPQEHQEDAVDDLLLLEEEIQAPEPRKPRIKRTLKRLQNLASNVSSTTRFLAAVAKITTKLQELGFLPDYPPS